MIKTLRDILEETKTTAGASFSGIGLIVSDVPNRLPILPIRHHHDASFAQDLMTTLASISRIDSEFHDGFHILTSDWKLSHISQYFSPPIADIVLDRSKRFGGRYVAAIMGSVIPDILLTGLASRDFGVSVFQNGVEVLHEPNP